MNAPAIGVLALQGDVREHRRVLGSLGVHTVEVRRAADLDRVAGLVIPGGESTAMSVLLGSSDLLDPLRARLAAGMPTLGTCAGMILLAAEVIDGRTDQQRLGGASTSRVRRNAFGRQVDSFETDLDRRQGWTGPPSARRLHTGSAWWSGPVPVSRCSPRCGGRDGVAIARWSAARASVLVAAFHPELSGDTRLHQLFLDVVAAAPAATLTAPVGVDQAGP